MSKINIDRIVKDIKSKTTSLTPVIEAVCNSIDAIGPERTDGVIDIIVKRTGQRSLNLDNTHTLSDIVSIDIVDNGIGFTEENKDSFDTYRSGFKMSKGGKGFGRFMYLKYFNQYWKYSRKGLRSLHSHKIRRPLYRSCNSLFCNLLRNCRGSSMC